MLKTEKTFKISIALSLFLSNECKWCLCLVKLNLNSIFLRRLTFRSQVQTKVIIFITEIRFHLSFLTAIHFYQYSKVWKFCLTATVNALNGNIIMWSLIAWLLQSTQCIILALSQTICSQVIGLGHDSQHTLSFICFDMQSIQCFFHLDFWLFFDLNIHLRNKF